MTKELQYSGFTTSPSDYECPDGALAAALNLINEDGALHPLPQPSPLFNIDAKYRLLAIHDTPNYRHYIAAEGSNLCWSPDQEDLSSGTATVIHNFGTAAVRSVHPMGNMLIVSAADSLHYIIFRSGAYAYLGTHIPEISMVLSLHYENNLSGNEDLFSTTVSYGEIQLGHRTDPTKASILDCSSRYIDGVLSLLNQAVSHGHRPDRTTISNFFCLPFFVRYAVRLYDGSLVNHSAPVLIVPSGGFHTPFGLKVSSTFKSSEDTHVLDQSTMELKVRYYTLKYRLSIAEGYDIADWKDIIQSVDIFFSQPVYTYKTDPKPEDITLDITAGNNNTQESHGNKLAEDNLNILRKLEENATFHHVLTLEYENLGTLIRSTDSSYFRTRPEYLENLAVREAMTDDFHTHDTYAANAIFSYNSRLNIADISRTAFSGFAANHMLQFHPYEELSNTEKWSAKKTDICVELEFGDHTSAVVANFTPATSGATIQPFCRFSVHPNIGGSGITDAPDTPQYAWFFYPDRRAKRMLIRQFIGAEDLQQRPGNDNNLYTPDHAILGGQLPPQSIGTAITEYRFEIPLKQHPFLNGAYALIKFDEITNKNIAFPGIIDPEDPNQIQEEEQTCPISPAIEHLPNMVYLSEVNNPFLFPATHAVSVGNGIVRGLSSAVRPLSTGQFGQFPLYAFSTEGVWALELTSTGTYSARQPITRDVCTNTESITQLDSSVLFATDRGIMQLSGSQATCITEAIDSQFPFDVFSLPSLNKVFPVAKDITICPFQEYLNGSRMLYDYTHQTVRLFNPRFHYAYVLSLRSMLWSMEQTTLQYTINAYPRAIGICKDDYIEDGTYVVKSEVVDYSATLPKDCSASVAALLVTRPLKLDAPDVLKTVDAVIQRGMFARGHVQSVLYGSRDLSRWFPVWSSTDHYLRGFRGTPYKYFRIALIANLDPGESIFGATVNINPRLTDQPR